GELRDLWEDILADYEQPGITVKEVDGEWYVSPIATSFDQFFAVTHALDRDERERAADAITEAVGSIDEVYNDTLDDFDDLGDVATGSTTDSGGGTAPAEGSASSDPDREWLPSPRAEEAADCFAAAIDAGDLPEGSMPVELEFPEC